MGSIWEEVDEVFLCPVLCGSFILRSMLYVEDWYRSSYFIGVASVLFLFGILLSLFTVIM